ncbi:hypothetical protein QQF64_025111 [Cirrhinus molitorella]|uniref:Uncharacterized protein n=1 Tax=Cirrhinus molitorella TaxID=172907 RepID=A0ABR3NP35_9TELE
MSRRSTASAPLSPVCLSHHRRAWNGGDTTFAGEKACLEPASLAVGPTTERVIKADRPCHTSAQRVVPSARAAVQLLLVDPWQNFKGWLNELRRVKR